MEWIWVKRHPRPSDTAPQRPERDLSPCLRRTRRQEPDRPEKETGGLEKDLKRMKKYGGSGVPLTVHNVRIKGGAVQSGGVEAENVAVANGAGIAELLHIPDDRIQFKGQERAVTITRVKTKKTKGGLDAVTVKGNYPTRPKGLKVMPPLRGVA